MKGGSGTLARPLCLSPFGHPLAVWLRPGGQVLTPSCLPYLWIADSLCTTLCGVRGHSTKPVSPVSITLSAILPIWFHVCKNFLTCINVPPLLPLPGGHSASSGRNGLSWEVQPAEGPLAIERILPPAPSHWSPPALWGHIKCTCFSCTGSLSLPACWCPREQAASVCICVLSPEHA